MKKVLLAFLFMAEVIVTLAQTSAEKDKELNEKYYLIGWCPHQPKHVINDEFDASRLPISIIL
jgi:hypothetical protein